uniref:Uncharacterized protein n=1 Tax=Avena sativa TaxID=4498 RepID=A0ACD5XV91_AVESA
MRADEMVCGRPGAYPGGSAAGPTTSRAADRAEEEETRTLGRNAAAGTKLASQCVRPCVRDTMRVLRECRDCVCPAVSSYPSMTHHSSIGQVQQLWNKWEIQMMVMVSFSLQVFLLSLAGFRKRHSSSVLNMVLWLAYLSADSAAVFVLGRLTLYTGEPRHQLLLFWAPFVLFHLGGQETITAFSMEDCKLWKRHLLNLTTQVSLATYVVAKQWHGGNQLVAPMVFMFISGTVKYAERIWALKVATETREPGSSSFARLYFSWFAEDFYNDMANIISQKDEKNFRRIMESVQKSFWLSLHFVMDVTPSVAGHGLHVLGIVDRIEGCEDSANHLVYRIAEIHLSLLCDYLYTRIEGIKGVVRRFITLVLTSIALALFLAARVQDMGYSRADVTISYILLVGALMMEISSILMWVLSPYWPYMSVSYLNWYADYYRSANRIRILVCDISKAAGTVLLHVIRCTPRPENRVEWSRKMKQYNMLHGCIHEKQAGRLEKMMRRIGIKQGDCITYVVISSEEKRACPGNLLMENGLDAGHSMPIMQVQHSEHSRLARSKDRLLFQVSTFGTS